MGMMTSGFVLLLTLTAAQGQTATDPTAASAKVGLDMVKGWVTTAAAQVPEEMYAFKPTPDVRSLGAVIGHIADANFMICGMASGEKPTMSGIEKSATTKADLTAALAKSYEFCEAAFSGMTAARADEVVKFFLPGNHTRLSVLTFNTAHNFEHYGNIVTYMRLKGLVPPSSAGR